MAKRPEIPRDEISSFFSSTDVQTGKGRDEETAAQRWGRPTYYRLSDGVRDAISAVADTERVAKSELVEYALADFLRRYRAGEIELPKQPKSPAAFSLDTPDVSG